MDLWAKELVGYVSWCRHDLYHCLHYPPPPSQVQIQGLPDWLLSSFTVGIWERPSGGYGHRLLILAHGGAAARGESGCSCWASTSGQRGGLQSPVGSPQGRSHDNVSGGRKGVNQLQAECPPAEASGEHHWMLESGVWGPPPEPRKRPVLTKVDVDGSTGAVTITFDSFINSGTRVAGFHTYGHLDGSTELPAVTGGGAHGAAESATLEEPVGDGGVERTMGERAVVVLSEGDLKVQLFSGRWRGHEPVFMHRSSQFYAWLPTPSSQQQGSSRMEHTVVTLPQNQLDKLSKKMKDSKRILISIAFHLAPAPC